MRTTWVAAAIISLAFACGCRNESSVNTTKPPKEFAAEVKEKLAGFEAKVQQTRDAADGKPEGTRNTVETQMEMAEKKIETVRDTLLPSLDKAVADKDADKLKNEINGMLDEISDAIDKANRAMYFAITAEWEPPLP